jgi:PKD repeat protein
MAPNDPQEGDAVQFQDLSYSPMPGVSIVAWLWNINGEQFNSQNPYYIFPDEGTYDVSLTVTDSNGHSTTIEDGVTASDGDPVPLTAITNASPLVNALNVEGVSGDEITLTGRLLDAGSSDSHAATFSVAGDPVTTVEEENEPLVSSGLITAPFLPLGNGAGTLTVTDEDGDSGSDAFSITAVPANQRSRHEPNNFVAGAPVLQSDGQYVSWIQEEGDVDIFKVRLPSGSVLKPGSEILATLSDQPADLDVAILAEPPTGASTGFSRVGFSRVGFSRVGFSRVDSSVIGFSRVGFSRVGFSRVGFSRVGLQTFNSSGVGWADIGFSRVGFSRVGFSRVGAEVTPVDLSLDELGLGGVGGSDLQVADFSANRGLDDETAWAVSSIDGTEFYIAVFGPNGEHSLENYTLGIEVQEPPDLEFDLGPVCDGSPLVPSGQTTAPIVLHDYDDPGVGGNEPADTVIVTQEQRMRATYGMDDAAWNGFLAQLTALAQHTSVRADIVSLPSAIYDDWDVHPCSIEAVNSVATQIKAILESPSWAGAQNVVIAGSDNIVPFRRVADDTVIGNEKDYLLDSFQEEGSPLFASIAQGYILSDDYYADSIANAWQGGELYIPDRPIGRLVETPAEITAAAQAFLDSNGVLNPTTGFVAGYDFFQDGADVIGDNLESGLSGPVERMINETWTADDLRCRFLGEGASPACGTRDVSAPNAHFTHYAALSANGFGTDDFGDYVGSDEVATAGGGAPLLVGDVVFSMGCHAGFNAPDETSEPADESTGIDPSLDFAQAMARQRAVYVASTGFGLGDDQGLGGTEKLLGIFAEKLLGGGASAGQALVDAKETYLSELSVMTVYDVKSSIEASFYGLPMYQVQPSSSITLQAKALEEELVGNVEITTMDAASTTPTVTTSHTLESVTTANGVYFTLDDDSQATAGRPIQPKYAFNVDDRHPHSGAPPPVHSVLVTGATYTEVVPNDPVFARPTLEWETLTTAEYQECLDSFSPADNLRLNSLETADGLVQTVVLVAGQFKCTSGGVPVTGIERLYDTVSIELRRCDSPDLTPPSINDIQIRGEGDSLRATIDASDDSGIKRIVLLKQVDGAVTPTELVLSEPTTSGVFELVIPNAGVGDDLIVQVEDVNCNVARDTGKGAGRNFILVDVGPDQAIRPLGTATLTATIQGFDDLEEPVWFVWEFGDGSFLDGVLAPESLRTVPVTINPDGSASFTVQHKFTTPFIDEMSSYVEIHDAAGGIGVDDIDFVCAPTPSDTDCDLVFNTDEPPCDGDPLDGDIRPERLDGAFQGVSDDGDIDIDEPLAPEFLGQDCDGDGYIGSIENHVFSYLGQVNGDQKTCGEYDLAFPDPIQVHTPSRRWPSDLVSGGVPDSTNRITITDVTSFVGPVPYSGTNVGTKPGDVRWDLAPGKGIYGTDINIADVTAVVSGRSGSPPMLDGARAFGGPPCPWPQ